MVGSVEQLVAVGGTHDEACMPVQQAMNEGARHYGVVAGLGVLRILRDARENHNLSADGILAKHVRTAEQDITVQQTGCTNSNIIESNRLIVVGCPETETMRCKDCVLNLGDVGKGLQRALERSREKPPASNTTNCF